MRFLQASVLSIFLVLATAQDPDDRTQGNTGKVQLIILMLNPILKTIPSENMTESSLTEQTLNSELLSERLSERTFVLMCKTLSQC